MLTIRNMAARAFVVLEVEPGDESAARQAVHPLPGVMWVDYVETLSALIVIARGESEDGLACTIADIVAAARPWARSAVFLPVVLPDVEWLPDLLPSVEGRAA
jgi:hypothetical protein